MMFRKRSVSKLMIVERSYCRHGFPSVQATKPYYVVTPSFPWLDSPCHRFKSVYLFV